ncbi:MAG: hypothetical protein GY696_32995 [Gammaproteobacteria bacterium]|nr:hypothetical protein [Gammaproteobacteria bacterium]
MLKNLIKPLGVIVAITVMGGFSQQSWAARWLWLENSSVYQFTDKDWDLLRGVVLGALNHGEDGKRAEWNNPDSGHSGSITPLDTFEREGMRCRKTKFVTASDIMTGRSEFLLCKIPSGEWKVAPSRYAKKHQ